MAFIEDHKAKFEDLFISLEAQNRSQLKREANGGNSILFVFPPEDESMYVNHFQNMDKKGQFYFIDVSKKFVEFIDQDGWDEFQKYYNEFLDTPHKVFTSEDETPDLMDLIVSEILKAAKSKKIPVLVKTGALYGTGIENVNIMEHKEVMRLNTPLVIMYPSKIENENLYFLNFKLASKYRCTVIN